jgi:hypothetical protein
MADDMTDWLKKPMPQNANPSPQSVPIVAEPKSDNFQPAEIPTDPLPKPAQELAPAIEQQPIKATVLASSPQHEAEPKLIASDPISSFPPFESVSLLADDSKYMKPIYSSFKTLLDHNHQNAKKTELKIKFDQYPHILREIQKIDGSDKAFDAINTTMQIFSNFDPKHPIRDLYDSFCTDCSILADAIIFCCITIQNAPAANVPAARALCELAIQAQPINAFPFYRSDISEDLDAVVQAKGQTKVLFTHQTHTQSRVLALYGVATGSEFVIQCHEDTFALFLEIAWFARHCDGVHIVTFRDLITKAGPFGAVVTSNKKLTRHRQRDMHAPAFSKNRCYHRQRRHPWS